MNHGKRSIKYNYFTQRFTCFNLFRSISFKTVITASLIPGLVFVDFLLRIPFLSNKFVFGFSICVVCCKVRIRLYRAVIFAFYSTLAAQKTSLRDDFITVRYILFVGINLTSDSCSMK